nr:50S ribosomal protein L1 [Candidatus Sneabacter namystus]
MEKKLSKNMKATAAIISSAKSCSVLDAIDAIQKSAFVKFDSTLEVALKLGIDAKQSNQSVRGVVSLPGGTGKSIRVAVICKDPSAVSVANADIVGSNDLIDEISAGVINFDVCIATPEMMGQLGRVAKILGPKGLMPNPKLGTVATDIVKAVNNAKSGQVEFRSDRGGSVCVGVGKLSFSKEILAENVKVLVDAVLQAKPSSTKGEYLKRMFLSSTMGKSVRIDISEILSSKNKA